MSALTTTRVNWLVGIGLTVTIAVCAIGTAWLLLIYPEQALGREQPIPFSHRLHVTDKAGSISFHARLDGDTGAIFQTTPRKKLRGVTDNRLPFRHGAHHVMEVKHRIGLHRRRIRPIEAEQTKSPLHLIDHVQRFLADRVVTGLAQSYDALGIGAVAFARFGAT